jgi:hypothetical protein
MPPALTPALALEYVHELSADVRAGIVLDGAGNVLAGPPALAEPARALLAAGSDAGELEAATADGVVCAVRTPAHVAVAICGRFAIAAVVRQDLRAALAALEGRAPQPYATAPPHAAAAPPPRPTAPPPRAVEPAPAGDVAEPALLAAANRLISAVQCHSEA